jgi:hypothetical protein
MNSRTESGLLPQSAELHAAIRDTRAGLRSPRVLAALGIEVDGAWSPTR